MSRVWVVDASPLILLGKISQIDLLTQLAAELIIPSGVAREIEQGAGEDPSRLWLRGPGASLVRPVDAVAPVIAAWDLGLGESHVLHLCRTQPGAEAIVDDRAARSCAAALGIPVRGTLAVLVVAKREGLIGSVRPLFEGLIAKGLRVQERVMERALELAGE